MLPSKAALALYQKLHRRSVREAEGLWLVEGMNAVQAALKAALTPVCLLARHEVDLVTLPTIASLAPEAMLARLATTDSPPGVIGVFQAKPIIAQPMPGERWLVLAGLQDPGNVGTLIRCLRAFNGTGIVVMPHTVDIYNPKVIRATTGEVFFCPTWELTDWENLDRTLPIFGTRANKAMPYQQADWSHGGLLVLGQEGNGLVNVALPDRTQWLQVPQNPAVDSLNVAISGAIIMALWMMA
jgi:RNA methyltransferase, TrmH family